MELLTFPLGETLGLPDELHQRKELVEADLARAVFVHLGDLYAESGQTLQGTFSAVSKPNFASTYALERSRRDLHNALLCTGLKAQIFV